MAPDFKNDWGEYIGDEFSKPYYLQLRQFLISEYKNYCIYPDMNRIFEALHSTSFKDTKVCIIGQDPYHGPGQAHGLCFSVQPQVKIPPSLINIYKELKDDLGYDIPNHGYLISWAQQGVLMLNAVLTVRAGAAASHRKKGWEIFTDTVIRSLNERSQPIVFILWGNFAQSKESLITNPVHQIIRSAHPSPLSARRGFFGSKPFSRTNNFLISSGIEPVNWEIKNI
jgi:uracil-DNA glycosylase